MPPFPVRKWLAASPRIFFKILGGGGLRVLGSVLMNWRDCSLTGDSWTDGFFSPQDGISVTELHDLCQSLQVLPETVGILVSKPPSFVSGWPRPRVQ